MQTISRGFKVITPFNYNDSTSCVQKVGEKVDFIEDSLIVVKCNILALKSLKTYISWEEFGVTALKKNENCCLFLCLDDTKLPRTLYTRTGGVCVWYQKHKKVYNMKQF